MNVQRPRKWKVSVSKIGNILQIFLYRDKEEFIYKRTHARIPHYIYTYIHRLHIHMVT